VSKFLPILTPSTPRQRARATLATNASRPTLLKPKRLISALARTSRNSRGRGLPACGRGVTVPTSMKPKPSCARASMCSAFLSRPAASPTGLGNSSPMARTGDDGTFGASSRSRCDARAASASPSVSRCAVSGSSANSSGRASA